MRCVRTIICRPIQHEISSCHPRLVLRNENYVITLLNNNVIMTSYERNTNIFILDPKRRFTCPHCQKSFSRKSVLQKHLTNRVCLKRKSDQPIEFNPGHTDNFNS